MLCPQQRYKDTEWLFSYCFCRFVCSKMKNIKNMKNIIQLKEPKMYMQRMCDPHKCVYCWLSTIFAYVIVLFACLLFWNSHMSSRTQSPRRTCTEDKVSCYFCCQWLLTFLSVLRSSYVTGFDILQVLMGSLWFKNTRPWQTLYASPSHSCPAILFSVRSACRPSHPPLHTRHHLRSLLAAHSFFRCTQLGINLHAGWAGEGVSATWIWSFFLHILVLRMKWGLAEKTQLSLRWLMFEFVVSGIARKGEKSLAKYRVKLMNKWPPTSPLSSRPPPVQVPLFKWIFHLKTGSSLTMNLSYFNNLAESC